MLPVPAILLALTLLGACAGTRHPLTPVSAGTLAARLANERCEKEFGKRPFAPDDFGALLPPMAASWTATKWRFPSTAPAARKRWP
jgi:hypothetical protein